jgi:hypothetical protein
MHHRCVFLRNKTRMLLSEINRKVQRTAIFVAMVRYLCLEGAAHRNIKFNVTVRCTFNLDIADFCYKYYGALLLKFL